MNTQINARAYYEKLMRKVNEVTGKYGFTPMWSHREDDMPIRTAIFKAMRKRGIPFERIALVTQTRQNYAQEMLAEYKDKDCKELKQMYKELMKVEPNDTEC